MNTSTTMMITTRKQIHCFHFFFFPFRFSSSPSLLIVCSFHFNWKNKKFHAKHTSHVITTMMNLFWNENLQTSNIKRDKCFLLHRSNPRARSNKKHHSSSFRKHHHYHQSCNCNLRLGNICFRAFLLAFSIWLALIHIR